MRDERVPLLRARLAITGDLEGADFAAPQADSADPLQAAGTLVYDDGLEAAVRRFHTRHGLTADGLLAALEQGEPFVGHAQAQFAGSCIP